jgi:3-phosphoshikimate 1-carboxyvinyltransferase
MIAAIASGVSHINNYSTSADCGATLSCLEKLGVQIERHASDILIHGAGLDGLSAFNGPLDCGNSGTTMRLLAGILAGHDFVSSLSGDESLRSRPMQRIIEPLEMMGAEISSIDGRAPLRIRGATLKPIDYELLTASAQVKSCILLAGLRAQGRTTVIENEVTRDHTERMLAWFAAPVETGRAERESARFAAVTGPAQLQARDVSIPGDISSAAYFVAAAALLPGSSLQIDDAGINPTRIGFLDQLRSMGFEIAVMMEREDSNEPRGDILVRASSPNIKTPFRIDGAIIPQLIDELPLLAVVGSQIEGGVEIRDAKELRVKESDRIASTVAGLRSMGCEVEEFDDGLRVDGPTKLRAAKIDPRGDHRIAMAFTVAALIAEGDSEIDDADCVAVSFPEFFDLLESVVQR